MSTIPEKKLREMFNIETSDSSDDNQEFYVDDTSVSVSFEKKMKLELHEKLKSIDPLEAVQLSKKYSESLIGDEYFSPDYKEPSDDFLDNSSPTSTDMTNDETTVDVVENDMQKDVVDDEGTGGSMSNDNTEENMIDNEELIRSSIKEAEEVKMNADDIFDSPVTDDDSQDDSQDNIIVENSDSIDSEVGKNEELVTSDKKTERVPYYFPDDDEKFQWFLVNDIADSKYDNFYEEKAYAVRDIISNGGPIPFRQYTKELINSSVDMSDAYSFDKEIVYQKMNEVRRHRDRVQEMAIHCNSQSFPCSRYVDLFHGVLARVEYEKPVVKQDGLVYEHMKDLEIYNAKLESLTKSTDQVLKTLMLAFDLLSRQLTIIISGYTRDVESRQAGASKQIREALSQDANDSLVQDSFNKPKKLNSNVPDKYKKYDAIGDPIDLSDTGSKKKRSLDDWGDDVFSS